MIFWQVFFNYLIILNIALSSWTFLVVVNYCRTNLNTDDVDVSA